MRRGIAVLLAGEDPRLSTMARAPVLGLQVELRELDERISHYDVRVKATCLGDVRSVKVQALPGIGPTHRHGTGGRRQRRQAVPKREADGGQPGVDAARALERRETEFVARRLGWAKP